MKILIILLSTVSLILTAYANDSREESEYRQVEVTSDLLSSGEVTNNIININVNGMVCDFCAQSIEKVFMKRIEVKGIYINLEDQKVVVYLDKETDIENIIISTILEDAGYTVKKINRNS